MAYDPTDWYWNVQEFPGQVWSSARFAYVGTQDSLYLRFLALNNVPANSTLADLAFTMLQQTLPQYFAAGLAVTSSGNPSISSTYALDPLSQNQIGSLARDSASGLGLPGGVSVFNYPDINSVPRPFASGDIVNLYKAIRDYINAVTTAVSVLVRGDFASLPANTVSIP